MDTSTPNPPPGTNFNTPPPATPTPAPATPAPDEVVTGGGFHVDANPDLGAYTV